MSELAARLAVVEERIVAACARAGRDRAAVRLLAVSKRHPAALVREAHGLGLRDFGESYAQELVEKHAALRDLSDIRWHFIGHLQRNKAKQVVATGARVATVDSIRLLDALDAAAAAAGSASQVYLQVNAAADPQKSGCTVAELPALVERARACAHLDLRGLMTIPAMAPDPEDARPVFARMRRLAEQHGLSELSMGMSDDLEVAIEEGATIVRVGTAIFGERP